MISVVLPTYNGEKYLSQAINSIIAQSFSDWKLIIVDDCSDDNTGIISERFAESDSRISVIHNSKNHKLPASLNIGFRASFGEYLTWTSDDNVYLPNAFSRMKDYLDSHADEPMVCAKMLYIDEEGKCCGDARSYSELLMQYNNCVGACFLYRKNAEEQIGLYDESLFGVEDYDYWLRVSSIGRIGFIDEVLYNYRLHPNSLTSTRWLDIKMKLNRLRRNRIDQITSKLRESPELLSAVFFEMLMTGDLEGLYERFAVLLPYLDRLVSFKDDENRWMVYGAGEYGDKAFDILGDKIAYYVDSDVKKIGSYKNGIEIIDKNRMMGLRDEYHVMVSLGCVSAYTVAKDLIDLGVTDITTFYHLQNFCFTNKNIRKD